MHQQQHPSQQAAGNMAAPRQPINTGSSPVPQFRRLAARHILFKMAFGGLFLTLVLFVVGVFYPAWLNRDSLWTACSCRDCLISLCPGPGMLSGVRAMEAVAVLLLLASLCAGLYQEVLRTPPPPDSKAVEILAGLAGLLGLTGVTVFGAWYAEQRPGRYDYYWRYTRLRLGWAFSLTAAGSVLILLCSILIAWSRVRHAARTKAIMAARGIYILPASAVYVPPGREGPQGVQAAGHPNGQPVHPNSQAAHFNGQGGYHENQAPYPDPAQNMQAGVYAGYPATPQNMQGACHPPPASHPSLEQGGIYPDLATYYAAHLPSAALATRLMTSQMATAPPASDMPRVNEGASTSSNPCSPSRKIATSSLPVCYVVNEGKTIPVYDEVPEVIVTAAP